MDSITPTPPISALHQAYLEARAVTLAIALAAGLASISQEEVATRLERQSAPCGGLFVPYLAADGSTYYARVRLGPDAPPDAPKFLAPAEPVRPYFPPSEVVPLTTWSGNAEIFITEGPIKALAVSAAGWPAIGLGGVNAGGHDAQRWHDDHELVPHPDLRGRGHLQQRPVTVIFDAGRISNPRVAYGEAMLARALLDAGAVVRVAALPLHQGADQGPDDLLGREGRQALEAVIAAARTADPLELVRLLGQPGGRERADAFAALLNDLPWVAAVVVASSPTQDLIADELGRGGIGKKTFRNKLKAFQTSLAKQGSANASATNERYKATEQGIVALRVDSRTGSIFEEQLSNFDARIVEEAERDDGVEVQRLFAISITVPGRGVLPVTLVKASDFSGMNWVLEGAGATATIRAGNGARDRLREAIQILSSPVRRRYFAHTGFREIDGTMQFLHYGGAVGGSAVEMDLEAPFDRVRLPDVAEDVPGAVRFSLDFLRCGPRKILTPIWSAVYLGPVAFILEPDFVLWLLAQSGQWKSSIAAVAQSHYGAVTRKNLLASWESTGNHIEALLSIAKDILIVVDDFAPKKSIHDQREIEKHGARVVRAVGNHSGRGRMRQDTTLRPVRHSRAVVVSTGEEIPPGLSVMARLFVVRVTIDELNKVLFSHVQANVQRLPHAMRGYIEWLIPQFPALVEKLRAAFTQVHTLAQQACSGHARIPEGIAHLYLGLDLGLQFATEIGGVSLEEADAEREQGWAALVSGATDQGQRVREEDPAVFFTAKLTMLLAQGRVCLLPRASRLDQADRTHGTPIGWVDDNNAFILPDAARDAVSRIYGAEGFAMPSDTTLTDALSARGVDRTQHRLGGKRARVYVFPLASLGLGEGEDVGP